MLYRTDITKEDNIELASLFGVHDTDQTALSRAVVYHDLTTVKLLSALRYDVNEPNARGETPLYIAAMNGYSDIAILLLEKGAEPNFPLVGDGDDLPGVVGKGSFAMVDLLLSHGAEVNTRSSGGKTALMIAAERGYVSLVTLLLQKGAEMNAVATGTGRTALHWALSNPTKECYTKDSRDVIRLLIKDGAEVNAKDKAGDTALLIALNRIDLDCLRLGTPNTFEAVIGDLLASGATARVANSRGDTALHLAAVDPNGALPRMLLASGADIEARNHEGKTPLMSAVENGNGTAVRVLLEAGANAGNQDNEGVTPLMMACKNGNREAVGLLLEHGAETTVRDNEGRTAVQWIVDQNPAYPERLEIIGMLLNADSFKKR